MAKFDEQLSRMNYLMEYKNAPKGISTNIEYCTTGADGKVYGILKEGTKYYIKTTESGKENLSESYSYIGGYMEKKANEFKSYNDATKHLELTLMSLNEAAGKHEDVSTVDFNKSEKVFATLTEDARTELNRIQQIMENCEKCGKPQTDYGKGPGDGFPFDNGTEANMDYKGSKETKPENANKQDGYKDVKDADNKLQHADKMAKGGDDCPEGKKVKDSDVESDGNCIACQDKKGAKAVKMNESMFDDDEYEIVDDDYENNPNDEGIVGIDDENVPESDLNPDEFEELPIDGEDSDEDLDTLLEELGNCCDDDEFTGPTTDNPKKSISMKEGPKEVNEDADYPGSVETGEEAFGAEPHKAETISMAEPPSKQKMNESLKRKIKAMTESVVRELLTPKKRVNESIEEKIQRMVNEEVTKLNVWGQHPSYRKQPMTTPPNKEVKAGTADHDWNDDSAKGEQPYGEKIGSSFPFDKKVEMLTDNVLSQLKESLLKKK